jgi:hypothetical protein
MAHKNILRNLVHMLLTRDNKIYLKSFSSSIFFAFLHSLHTFRNLKYLRYINFFRFI